MENRPVMLRRWKISRPALISGNFMKKLRYRIAAVFLAAFLLPSIAPAEQDAERINQVKAAFILNIARFVDWPSETLDPQSDRLQLCMYRNNSFGEAITGIEGEPASGRRLHTVTVANLTESASCNILLIAANELKTYMKEVQPDTPRPMLIIADRTDEEEPKEPLNTIIVTLVRNGSRIGFEINLERSRQVGLKMSSKLLKLATIVDGN